MLRWKAVEIVFATLSFSLQVFRYPGISAMSEVSVSSTVVQFCPSIGGRGHPHIRTALMLCGAGR